MKSKIILSVLVTATMLASCGNKELKTVNDKSGQVNVTLGTPASQGGSNILISGQAEAVQKAVISTRMMGQITSLPVKMGDRVHKGQLLVTISSGDIQARRAQAGAAIAEAEANVKSAQKDYDRYTALFSKQSASAKELENVTLQYHAAQSRLEAALQMKNEASALLAYTSLTAPFDGMITQKNADQGGLASPGQPLLVLEQDGLLQLSGYVSEADINKVSMGTKATAVISAAGITIPCTVSAVNTSSLNSGGQYEIKLAVARTDQQALRSGMYANISIPVSGTQQTTTAEAQILVPLTALVHNDQLTGLYTVSSSNTALLRWVRTGKTYGNNIEILSGLAADESFILQAEGKLYNGVPVSIRK
jgi:RND family efflux transporter MFP subunit